MRLSRDLLIRGVAYKVQEQAHGGLSLGIKRRLHSLSEGSDQRDGSAAAPAITMKPGTKLVRQWHGHAHTVSVLDDGFEYRGERYPSLTRIARAARALLAEKEVFRDLEARATETHFARVRAGRVESVETSTLHLDVLRDLKRINSHIAAAAYPVLERLGELLPSRLRRDADAEDSGSTATELRDGRWPEGHAQHRQRSVLAGR
jgi:hypothetical protein